MFSPLCFLCIKLAGVIHMSTSVITITIQTRWSTMIIWMMGGIRVGLIPIYTSPNSINTLSNIEQGLMVDIFRHTLMSWNIIPTISYLGVIVDGLRPIPNSPITTNSISWKIQNTTTFTFVIGVIVSGLRSIPNYPLNNNYYSPIARGRVTGLLWSRFTSINISTVITRGIVSGQTWPRSTTFAITWGRNSGLLRPMPMTFTTSTINWRQVAGLKRTMSKTFL